jgi:hypothetical protein
MIARQPGLQKCPDRLEVAAVAKIRMLGYKNLLTATNITYSTTLLIAQHYLAQQAKYRNIENPNKNAEWTSALQ